MKKYTGFEAIERMKTNVIDDGKSLYRYNMEFNLIEFSMKDTKLPWQQHVIIDISFFFSREFVDYIEPLKVGDWIVAWSSEEVCKITEVDYLGRKGHVKTDYCSGGDYQVATTYRKATIEEIAQEKRRRVFKRHGRAIDEFKEGDIATPADNDKALLLIEDYNRQKNTVKIGGTYYTALDLNPLYFTENKVKIEN
ncbi:hypothetical protein [Bacillus cereus]|uniref:Phage protein n=1 Tax=Bacillus cereus TIAC219 TaxID=718222 RepID=A0ABC9STI0_BACCE|nr:hypothetical protein [Bacillus cereus]EJP81254.1 hypothetical protein IC1_06500 [Bacillus cereus VD022]EJP84663.1 hypothetical protein IC1_05191 [Bacillus cereus VD022]EOQ59346.1 hypothetical protein IAY_07146 [Bacillus cereus TIAC219]